VTIYIPMVLNPAPKAIGQDGEEYRVLFEHGGLGALLAYPTREAAEKAEPGKPVMVMELCSEQD